MKPRELVKKTMEFQNNTGAVPIDLWALPWAEMHYPNELMDITKKFPKDFATAPAVYADKPKTSGDQYGIGVYIDEWGCEFTNIQKGVIGEVKTPLILHDDWRDFEKAHIPKELLTFDIDAVNEFCKTTDKFVISDVLARPFERLQFIRGTENIYIDLLSPPKHMVAFIAKMHDFNCALIEKWAKTSVDGIFFMDDWGSQNSLLINPKMWLDIFAPLYKEYIEIAHKYGKKALMHSDGYILSILPHLIDMGLDAINSQIFCMGIDNLKQYKGEITFWGEIDRQHLLPNGTAEEIQHAVESVKQALWSNGGCIAQCEFGPGAKPENIEAVYKAWSN
ncbi:MAG: methyltransferase [Firmicutes bacterium]|nr:methyltransferase [Bacillota bacterium]